MAEEKLTRVAIVDAVGATRSVSRAFVSAAAGVAAERVAGVG